MTRGKARLAKTLAAAALEAVLLVSCWSPIYDETLSAAAVLSGKMDGLAIERRSIGPVDASFGGTNAMYEFLPSDFSDLACGVLAERDGDHLGARFFGYPGPASSAQVGLMNISSTEGFASRTLLISVDASASYAARFICIGNNVISGSHGQDLRIYYRDPSASADLVDQGTVLNPSVPTPAYIVAAGGVLDANLSDQDIAMLYWDPNSLAYQSYEAKYSGSIVGSGGYQVQGLASDMQLGGRFYRLNNDYYLSAYFGTGDAATLRSYRWADQGSPVATLLATPQELGSIKAPIVGILSQGLILAQDDLFLYCYSADGTPRFKVTAGNLRYVQELSVDGQDCALFSQVLIQQGSGEGSYTAKLWALRTADLPALGQ